MMNESTERAQPRLSFPAEELTFAWLTPLLEVYHLVDQGVAEGSRRERQRGKTLACAKGCSACCRSHATIPIYLLEQWE